MLCPACPALPCVCGSICRPGSFAQRAGPSGERDWVPGSPGDGPHPSVGNHDLFPPPSASLFVCCGLPSLLLRQYMGLSDGNTNLNIPQSHIPPWPSSDVQCPMAMSPSPSLLPLVPICDPIVGHVAGWTRPYSRQCRTEATLTGTAGPNVEFDLLESVLRYRRRVLLDHSAIRPSTHSLVHSIVQSFNHSVGSRWPGV